MGLSIVDPSTRVDGNPPPAGLMLAGSASSHAPLGGLKIDPTNPGSTATPHRCKSAHAAPGRRLNSAAEHRASRGERPHQSPPKILIARLSSRCPTKQTKRARPTTIRSPNFTLRLPTMANRPSCQNTKGVTQGMRCRKTSLGPTCWRRPRWLRPRREYLRVRYANEYSP